MRNYKIDLLRGISILLVLIDHFNIPYKLDNTLLGLNFFGESLSSLIARNGNYGVTMFFVISGFLITQNTLKRSEKSKKINIKDFYIRRIARIIPSLVLLVIMVTILRSFELKPFINQSPNGIEVSYGITIISVFTFWMNILIIENGWVNYALGALWSLSVEEVFYMAFPIFFLGFQKNKYYIVILLAIIAYAPYYRFVHFGLESREYLYHYFASFDGIAIGCLAAIYSHKIYKFYKAYRIYYSGTYAVSIFLCTN